MMLYKFHTECNSTLAQQIHQVFTSRGIVTFLAEDSIERIGETDYMVSIDKILDRVDVLVVIASSQENINSKWVAYECIKGTDLFIV
mgnify:CR=1 FL=1